jgi:hypothetical protein
VRIDSFVTEEHISLVLQMCCEEPGFVDHILYGKGTNMGLTQSDIAFLRRKLLYLLFLPSTQAIPMLLSSCRYLHVAELFVLIFVIVAKTLINQRNKGEAEICWTSVKWMYW